MRTIDRLKKEALFCAKRLGHKMGRFGKEEYAYFSTCSECGCQAWVFPPDDGDSIGTILGSATHITCEDKREATQ